MRLARPLLLACATALLAASCASDAAVPVNEVADLVAADTVPDTTAPIDIGGPGRPVVTVLSSEATMITGGDALVRIDDARVDATMSLNGKDVTEAFSRDRSGGFVGVISGLGIGSNSFAVESGATTTPVTLINFPARGPVFSGPHSEPLVCTTEQHGLGPALDGDCTAPTSVFWTYITTDDQVRPLPDATARPADLATISLNDELLPAIVRNEVGTLNRGVYWIHVLDPTPEEAIAGAWDTAGWNQRLVMRYGGGCASPYSQGALGPFGTPETGGPVDVGLLRQGYALAASTFTGFATHCNDVLSAETTMMMKERFIERYGVPDLTIGQGGSAGAIQQFLIAQNYPGLLDGIAASAPFPDWVTVQNGIGDCSLLETFYTTPVGQAFTPEQRTAVNGHLTAATCVEWNRAYRNLFDPSTGCDPSLANEVFNPIQNPNGLRCTVADANPAVYGIEGQPPATTFDNQGVQYGLRAMNDGIISVDQFLDVNDFVGSFDDTGVVIQARANADIDTVTSLYSRGRINQAAGDLRRIPIILTSVYQDDSGNIHDRWRVFSVLARIGGGGTEPPVNVGLFSVDGRGAAGFPVAVDSLQQLADTERAAVVAVDEWATAVLDDTSEDSRTIALGRTRPDAASDRCVLADGTVSVGDNVNAFDGPCGFPVLGDPRQVAGEQIVADIMKCARKDLDPTDYLVPFTIEQTTRLNIIFPDGSCDYTRPGLGEARVDGAWLNYGTDG